MIFTAHRQQVEAIIDIGLRWRLFAINARRPPVVHVF